MSNLVARLPDVEIVGTAQTGLEALDKIRALKPDIATLDIRMPDLNGISVLEIIQREGLKLSVIVLTGLAEAEYRRKCLELGAEHFFNKATEFDLVVDIIKDRAVRLNSQT